MKTYTISQVSEATGLSRRLILSKIQSGFITPDSKLVVQKRHWYLSQADVDKLKPGIEMPEIVITLADSARLLRRDIAECKKRAKNRNW